MDAAAPWGRLKQRAEFQRAGKGKRINAAAFTLQANARLTETPLGPRYGLTVTKKTGNSPARSRIKRRLREALRRIAPQSADPAFDYVVMARREALHQTFDALVADLVAALRRVHARKDGRS